MRFETNRMKRDIPVPNIIPMGGFRTRSGTASSPLTNIYRSMEVWRQFLLPWMQSIRNKRNLNYILNKFMRNNGRTKFSIEEPLKYIGFCCAEEEVQNRTTTIWRRMKAILETVANEFWTKKTKKSKFLFHPDLLCSFLSIVLSIRDLRSATDCERLQKNIYLFSAAISVFS